MRRNKKKKFNTWHEMVQRGLFLGMGFTEADFERPFIGIANTWSEANPGHYHLRSLAEAVKRGVWQAGGTPVEFNTISICDGMALDKRYHLPARDLIAFSTTHFLKAHGFSGCIFISSCDKNVPGQLMAAASVNIPSIFVTGGYMLPGSFRGEDIVCCTDGRRLFGEYEKGAMTEDEFCDLLNCTHSGVGACGTMGTANTMQIMTEALGMSLPGSAAVAAVMAKKYWIAEESGKQIMNLVKDGLTARKIMTRQAFHNAVKVLMAIGGSTNAILHLTAIAKKAGINLTLDIFDEISAKVPFICDVKPSGKYTVHDFAESGGVPSLQKAIKELLYLKSLTVTCKTLGENLDGFPAVSGKAIRSIANSLHPDGGLVVLRGNLAPEGAIIKKSGVHRDLYRHRGPARIFDSYMEFESLMSKGSFHLTADEVIVIRNEGPRGGPGMQEILIPPVLYKHGLENIVVITDGRTSGTSRGRLVLHVSPEAEAGGPLALIRPGDMIMLDIEKKDLHVEITQREMEKRKKAWQWTPKKEDDWLALYQKMALSAGEGGMVSLSPDKEVT
ncbi:MAG: dihydroxy-acid dehydratase [Deltaproteobacteria bacterium]|nr:dihydroxy-acid dehydratase [Deltaproteobacteria bacterium]